MDRQSRVLLRKAWQDREVLNFDLPDDIFGFHAQQAFEKLFKALIVAHGREVERTHDLEALLFTLRELGVDDVPLRFPVELLQPFAVMFRYDEGEVIPAESRQKIRAAIDVLYEFVARRVEDAGA